MPRVEPFRGVRYADHWSEHLAELIAPPYDVISPELQQNLYARHPYNYVRLELPEGPPGEERYRRAAARLREWSEAGVFVEDSAPSYYLYEQQFGLPEGVWLPDAQPRYRRFVLFAAVELVPWGEGIFPHERTLAAPKADRLGMLIATRANFSPVMGILDDPEGQLEERLRRIAETNRPLVQFQDDSGDEHRLWKIDRAEQIAELRPYLEAPIVIADGHHRYETALAYAEAQGARSPDDPARFVLMGLISAASGALLILPIHRIVSGLDSELLDRFPALLEERASLTSFADQGPEPLFGALRRAKAPAWGFYAFSWGYLLAVPRPLEEIETAGSPVAELEVVQLHEWVFREIFGLDADDPTAQEQIAYTIRASEAIWQVQRRTADLAAFLRPIRVSDVLRVARAGYTLPQKSTYFYPKLPSGLVFRRF